MFSSVPYTYCIYLVVCLIHIAYTFCQLGTVDKNFLLCFPICEKAIQTLVEERRKTTKAPIKNLNSLHIWCRCALDFICEACNIWAEDCRINNAKVN